MDDSAPRWSFWVQWVVAGAVGGAAFAALFGPLSMSVGRTVRRLAGGVAGEAVVGLLAMGGVLLGVAVGQWIVLRGEVAWAGWWLLAVAVSGMASGAAMLAPVEALGGTRGIVVGLVLGLSVFGVLQWLVLRGQVPWAASLASASVVGLAVAMPATAVLGPFGYGAAYGVVTGGVLMWQLGH